jgi:hypothetical protein
MALDSFARESRESFPSIAAIARVIGRSADTARRALHELAGLGLVTIAPRRRSNGSRTSNEYIINWIKLLQMTADDIGNSPTPPCTVPLPPLHRATSPLAPCKGHPKRPLKRPKKRHDGEKLNMQNISAGTRGWGKISHDQLCNPQFVNFVYRYSVAKGWIADGRAARLAFFALAHFCAVNGKTPGAYFTDCLRKKRFDVIRPADEEWARRAIAEREATPVEAMATAAGND